MSFEQTQYDIGIPWEKGGKVARPVREYTIKKGIDCNFVTVWFIRWGSLVVGICNSLASAKECRKQFQTWDEE